jgi:hypothetical protein
VLAEIGTTARGTQDLVQQQFREVLQAVISGAATTAEQAKIDPDRLGRRLLENVQQAVSPEEAHRVPERVDERTGQSDAPLSETAARRAALRRAAERRARRGALRIFPDESTGRERLEALRALSPDEQQRLDALGQDEVRSNEVGTFVGLSPTPLDEELHRKGLTKQTRLRTSDAGTGTFTVLTDEGKQLAGLLTAEGELPDWLDLSDVATYQPPPPADDDIPF